MNQTFTKGIAVAVAGVLASFGIAASAFAFEPTETSTTVTDITVQKEIQAPADADTAGMTMQFDFQAVAPISNGTEVEDGAFAVPAGVDLGTVTLTAAAGGSQTLTGTSTLPSADSFGHAGVYTFEVQEAVTAYGATDSASNWDLDQSKYRVRLYVINDSENPGHLKYNMETIEKIQDIDGNTVATKVDELDFCNKYDATTDLEVEKQISGDYANMSKKFAFNLTVTTPSTAPATGTYAYSGAASGELSVADHTGTITGFELGNGEKIKITGLPVGTTYSLVETDPTEGVNDYIPSAQYFYDGAEGATGVLADKTNDCAAGTAGAAYTVNVTSGDTNAQTALGVGDGNKVTVTNTLEDITPTGVLVANLPVALAIAFAMVAGGIVVASRKRDEQ